MEKFAPRSGPKVDSVASTARVLIIAGSDSGGGAGVQADIKTVAMLGGYPMTAITAVTAQNTLGVDAVHPIPAEMILAQMDSVIRDIGVELAQTQDAAHARALAHDADAYAAQIQSLYTDLAAP